MINNESWEREHKALGDLIRLLDAEPSIGDAEMAAALERGRSAWDNSTIDSPFSFSEISEKSLDAACSSGLNAALATNGVYRAEIKAAIATYLENERADLWPERRDLLSRINLEKSLVLTFKSAWLIAEDGLASIAGEKTQSVSQKHLTT